MDSHTQPQVPITPRTNRAAKRAVQTAKQILKQPDPYLALVSYWATPITATGASPAQLRMGRQIRTTVPTLDKSLQASPICHDQVQIQDSRAKKVNEYFYNRSRPALQSGQAVRVRKGMVDPC